MKETTLEICAKVILPQIFLDLMKIGGNSHRDVTAAT